MTDLYFDTAYICKCYLNEPDSGGVRELARTANSVSTSSLCIAEFACTIHRNLRDGVLTAKAAAALQRQFGEDASAGTWLLIPVNDRVLWRVETMTRALPKSTPLRAGDAIHIACALDEGFTEIWTNDRHLLAAAPHFGLRGRNAASRGTEGT